MFSLGCTGVSVWLTDIFHSFPLNGLHSKVSCKVRLGSYLQVIYFLVNHHFHYSCPSTTVMRFATNHLNYRLNTCVLMQTSQLNGEAFNLARIDCRWSFLFPRHKDSQASVKKDQRQSDPHWGLVFPPGPCQDLQNFLSI